MNLNQKLLALEEIFTTSEIINMINSHFDEDSAEEMILDLKRKIIDLLEK